MRGFELEPRTDKRNRAVVAFSGDDDDGVTRYLITSWEKEEEEDDVGKEIRKTFSDNIIVISR